jgi:serine/threonine-protein kinase RsbW
MEGAVKRVDAPDIANVEHLDTRTVKVTLKKDIDPNQCLEELRDLFDRIFESDINLLILDMEFVQFPNASFIAFLIGRTAEIRRNGGDIQIINITETARNHLAMFSSLTYLSVGRQEKVVLEDEAVEKPYPSEDDLIQFLEGIPCLLQVEAAAGSLKKVTDFVSVCAERAGLQSAENSKLKIAVYEACMNVIEHGYQFEPDELLGIEAQIKGDRLYISILDTGNSFDFYELDPYDVRKAMEEKSRGGYGLHMIQRSVDEIHYLKTEEGNRLTLIMNLPV